MNKLLAAMNMQAQKATQNRATTRHGIVTSYDPNNYAVKVSIQPNGELTGWIPLKSLWVGNNWGLFTPPNIGDACEVDFQEGDASVATSGLRFFSDVKRPLPCPSGEFWLVHKSGSLLKFHNDGSVELTSNQNLTATVGGNLAASVTGTVNITASGQGTLGASAWTMNGNLTLNGTLTATGNVSAPDVIFGGKPASTHKHLGVTAGGGVSGVPQ